MYITADLPPLVDIYIHAVKTTTEKKGSWSVFTSYPKLVKISSLGQNFTFFTPTDHFLMIIEMSVLYGFRKFWAESLITSMVTT